MTLEEAIKARHSVRAYKAQPLPVFWRRFSEINELKWNFYCIFAENIYLCIIVSVSQAIKKEVMEMKKAYGQQANHREEPAEDDVGDDNPVER